ncbi:MAG TPA: PEGA domain-containing protein [Kofleriaceae bacterium]|nr:PEGA domain-containing protein [Kofleriaceae bacterium]
MSRAWLVLAVIAAATGARADDAADHRAAAERYFHAGEQAYKDQSFEAAAEDFDRAYGELPLPEIAFSAAQAYRREFRVDPKVEYVKRAVELYRVYLDAVKTGGRVADAADALGDMQRELEKLIRAGAKVSPALAAEHTQLGISVIVPGARSGVHEIEDSGAHAALALVVTLDGKRVQPYRPINVPPGRHAIHVEASGYQPVDRDEDIVQGTASMIEIPLVAKPARVTVNTEDAASVNIDGRPEGAAPIAAVALPAGKHVVIILHRGRVPVARELTVGNGEDVVVAEPLVATRQRRAVPYVIGGGAVLGVLALGAAAGDLYYQHQAIAARDTIDRGNAPSAVLDDYSRERSRSGDFGVATSWLAGGALAAFAIGVGLYYFDNPLPDSVRVTPMVAPGGGGAVVVSHF